MGKVGGQAVIDENPLVVHYNVPGGQVQRMQFNPDGKRLLIISRATGILVYYLERARRPVIMQLPNKFEVRCGLWSLDGKAIFACSSDGRLASFVPPSQTAANVKIGHTNTVNAIDIVRSTGIVVSGSDDKTIKLWSQDFEFLGSLGCNAHVTSLACIPTTAGQLVLAGDRSGGLTIFDLAKAETASQASHARKSEEARVWSQTVKGEILHTSWERSGQLFTVATKGEPLSVWEFENPEASLVQRQREAARQLAFHPRKTLLLSVGENEVPSVWDLEKGAVRLSLEGHDKRATVGCWNIDGKQLATADEAGVVIVWNVPKPPKARKPVKLTTLEIASAPPGVTGLSSLAVLNEQAGILQEMLARLEERYDSLESRVAYFM